jgi:RNA polymerase sigma-70 factor (ECF subfamily)
MIENDPVEKPLSEDVVAKLVQNHREFLAFLERRVGSRADAEDILQEAFVRGVRNAGSVRDGESSSAWFYRVLRNAVVDHFRRRGAQSRAIEALTAEFDEETRPVEVRTAVCACVRELAQTLKPEYSEALEQIDVEGQTVQDFAEQRGISANNAGVRIFRARAALRTRVMASCGTCAEHGCLDCTCGTTKRP